jgi:hypothetical protein
MANQQVASGGVAARCATNGGASTMRFFVRATVPTVGGNRVIIAGKLGPTVEEIVSQLEPETIFFKAIDKGPTAGMKSIGMVLDLESAAQIKSTVEPLFAAMEAKIEYEQVLSKDELLQALPSMEANVKKYGDDGRTD